VAGANPTSSTPLQHGRHRLGQVLSQLGKTFLDGLRQRAADNNVKLEGAPDDPNADIPPGQIVTVLRSAVAMYFPLLDPTPPT
jgi:hypothetical protein